MAIFNSKLFVYQRVPRCLLLKPLCWMQKETKRSTPNTQNPSLCCCSSANMQVVFQWGVKSHGYTHWWLQTAAPSRVIHLHIYTHDKKNKKLLDITTQVTHQNHPNSTPTRRRLGLPGMWIDHLRKAEQGVAPRVRPWRRDHVTNDEQKYLAAGCTIW